MQKEPALTIGLITALAQAAIGLAIALGANISDTLQNAILAFISAAFPVIMLMALAIRQSVYSPNTVQQIKAESVKAGETGGAAPVVP
jgi:hypothetical protein